MSLQILFEDNHCLAVNKAAGLPTQGVALAVPSLEAQVKNYLKLRYKKPGNVYLGIPHRLDRPVSGVVLFARNTKAARRLAEQFRRRLVAKVYWAAVEGKVWPDVGFWEDWVLKERNEARVSRAPNDTPGARAARLRYQSLAADEECTLLEIRPETGRMHQIRVQASARGWPVIGDSTYGSRLPFGPQGRSFRECAIALHARHITFLHPLSYEPLTVTASPPEFWQPLRGLLPGGEQTW
jgi:23S rRNA pseudouridine1911/1915/1917 synthase